MSPSPVDEDALYRFVAALGDEPLERARFRVERVPSGHSNLTFLVHAGTCTYVLRRPPLGPLPPSAHDVIREYRFLERLAGTAARVPRPVAACLDLEVIGAPFYLMERVDGVVVRRSVPRELDRPERLRLLSESVVETLAELHGVDWRGAGLDAIAPTSGFLERQLRRWQGLWEHNRTRPIPEIDRVGAALEATRPPEQPPAVVHGDYKLDNLIVAPGERPRVAAIVDWELATIGDPLSDLGFLLVFWHDADEPLTGPLALASATRAEGFLTRLELRERYERLTGRSTERVWWYCALALWKLAILFEGSYRRHLAGTSDDPFFAELETGVPFLASRALALVEGRGGSGGTQRVALAPGRLD